MDSIACILGNGIKRSKRRLVKRRESATVLRRMRATSYALGEGSPYTVHTPYTVHLPSFESCVVPWAGSLRPAGVSLGVVTDKASRNWVH